jgi:hypothetical protein
MKSLKPLQSLRRASIPMQRQWSNMSIPNKIINKITKSDFDRDGTPNKWDCQPKNYFKQDSLINKKNRNWKCPNCGKIYGEDDVCPTHGTDILDALANDDSDDMGNYRVNPWGAWRNKK